MFSELGVKKTGMLQQWDSSSNGTGGGVAREGLQEVRKHEQESLGVWLVSKKGK